jgi:hypothetical protein
MRLHTLSLSLSLPLPGGPGLSAPNSSARAFFLSLSHGTSLSAVDRPLLCASLVRGPRLSATLLIPNLPPAHSAMDAPTLRISRPPPHAHDLLLAPAPHSLTPLAQLRPQSKTLAPSLALCTPRELRLSSPKSAARSTVTVEPSPRSLPR